MADKTKFEAISSQAIESEHVLLSNTDEAGDEIGVEPQALSWWQASKVVGVVLDLLALALSCAFFAFALAVKMHENMRMDSARVQLLSRLSKVVSIQAYEGSPSLTPRSTLLIKPH